MGPSRTSILSLGLRLKAIGRARPGKNVKAEVSQRQTASKELREKYVLGANIYKDGTDPEIKPDSEYPEWLFSLLDKKSALSELQRKKPRDLSLDELERLVKLENRSRIKQNNSVREKN